MLFNTPIKVIMTIIKWSKRHTVLLHTLNAIINFRAVQILPNGKAHIMVTLRADLRTTMSPGG